MNFLPLLVCALTGLVTTLVLIPIIRRWREPVIATASGRLFHHTHKTPVSRLGGLALAAAFGVVALVGFVCFAPGGAAIADNVVIVFASLAMFGLGLWDDLRPLGARKKLVGQILISTAVCGFGVQITQCKSPFSGEIFHLGMWAVPVTIFWLVALTNIINLIDGVDGLAGGIALMLMGLLTFVGLGGALNFPSLCAAGMFGALLGFLRYNFPPARIYMGDGGAYFLGFLIGLLTLVNSQKGTILAALIAPVFALALPITDVVLTILRRGLKGLPLFRADREHLHHKLLAAGCTRTRAVLILYAISAMCLLMAFGVFWSQGRWLPILFGFLCLLLLFSARTFKFSRDWFSVRRVLENSLAVRKDSQYALALSRWLELEAERSGSLEALWEDYVFAIRKLGFTAVELRIEDERRVWRSAAPAKGARTLWSEHDLHLNGGLTVAFGADGESMSPRSFEHLCELAAECWLKAATRWQVSSRLPLRFSRAVPQPNGFKRPLNAAAESA